MSGPSRALAVRQVAYGLSLALPDAIPGLPSSDRKPDIVVSTPAPDDPAYRAPIATTFSIAETGSVLSWMGIARFDVALSDPIRVTIGSSLPLADLRHALLGPVMAMILQARGHFVLHASAVRFEEWGLAFMGDKGAGKSTTAASLIAAGARLLCDDVVAVAMADGPAILPAMPVLKLLPDAADAFYPQVAPSPFKRDVAVGESFVDGPVPVRALCVLRRGERLALTRLTSTEGLRALMRYSYLGRFEGDAVAPSLRREHLRQAARLATDGLVFDLTVRDGLRDPRSSGRDPAGGLGDNLADALRALQDAPSAAGVRWSEPRPVPGR